MLLRTGVLLGGLLGAGGSAIAGWYWYDRTGRNPENRRQLEEARRIQEAIESGSVEGLTPEEMDESLARGRRQELALEAVPLLAAAALLGLVGGLLGIFGRTTNAAVWLLSAGTGPALLQPWTLVLTFPLFLAGLLSLLTTFLRAVAAPATN
jgi:hypothetical protein